MIFYELCANLYDYCIVHYYQKVTNESGCFVLLILSSTTFGKLGSFRHRNNKLNSLKTIHWFHETIVNLNQGVELLNFFSPAPEFLKKSAPTIRGDLALLEKSAYIPTNNLLHVAY